ncbi:hypothetical protein P152DRAFT_511642 [Eremomyces bilateralis CBS 781.70]|uniref:HCNGP-domain-containing protein n=1 Tax=Eremomyces bilateralis CBS 781.70 TaxID=1392243 RepID=A0A6G1GC75_9PEZI|nr:uncharacterized protein P152DRAFT_511642 [Eremomyces bilateralis CBS 781.70]KAF1815501.1 hypothetical protein P152DRAFT_511642 [Eremomyces bilateralis CBS 781.70]
MLGMLGLSYESSEDEDASVPSQNTNLSERQTVRAKEPSNTADTSETLPSRPITETPMKLVTPAVDTTPEGPALGPSRPQAEPIDTDEGPTSRPQSPYSANRTALRNLTLPPTPSFTIPSSPPGSPPASTAKFTQFLLLKKRGVHFNERLSTSAQLRNPALLSKLREFAGISDEEQYATALEGEDGVVVKWPEYASSGTGV